MVLALEIRNDRTLAVLRKFAKDVDDVRIARRILAIANALGGMSRDEAARAAGVDRRTLRDWVLRYNARGVDGLADRWNGGRRPTTSRIACTLRIPATTPLSRPRRRPGAASSPMLAASLHSARIHGFHRSDE